MLLPATFIVLGLSIFILIGFALAFWGVGKVIQVLMLDDLSRSEDRNSEW